MLVIAHRLLVSLAFRLLLLPALFVQNPVSVFDVVA
jgi:hypothetical protein